MQGCSNADFSGILAALRRNNFSHEPYSMEVLRHLWAIFMACHRETGATVMPRKWLIKWLTEAMSENIAAGNISKNKLNRIFQLAFRASMRTMESLLPSTEYSMPSQDQEDSENTPPLLTHVSPRAPPGLPQLWIDEDDESSKAPCNTTSGPLALCDLQPGIETFADFVKAHNSLVMSVAREMKVRLTPEEWSVFFAMGDQPLPHTNAQGLSLPSAESFHQPRFFLASSLSDDDRNIKGGSIASDNNSTTSSFIRAKTPGRDIGGGGDMTHMVVADPLGSLTPSELVTFRTTWCDIEPTDENGHSVELCSKGHREINRGQLRRAPTILDNRGVGRVYAYQPRLCGDVTLPGPMKAFHINCTKGSSCTFAHTYEELYYHPESYKSRRCTSGMACTNGRFCPFRHTSPGLGPSDCTHWVGVQPAQQAMTMYPSAELQQQGNSPVCGAFITPRRPPLPPTVTPGVGGFLAALRKRNADILQPREMHERCLKAYFQALHTRGRSVTPPCPSSMVHEIVLLNRAREFLLEGSTKSEEEYFSKTKVRGVLVILRISGTLVSQSLDGGKGINGGRPGPFLLGCIRMLASSLGARVAPDDWVKLLPLEESAHQTTPDGKEKLPDDVVQNEVAIVETGHSNLPSECGAAAAHGRANSTFSSAPRTLTGIPDRPPSHNEGLSYAYTSLFRTSSPKIAAATTEETANDGGHPTASASMDHGPSEYEETAKPKLHAATPSATPLVLQHQQKQEEEGEEGDKEELHMSTIQHLGVSEHLRGGKCVLPPLSDTINSITGPRSLHEAFKQSSSPKGALTTPPRLPPPEINPPVKRLPLQLQPSPTQIRLQMPTPGKASQALHDSGRESLFPRVKSEVPPFSITISAPGNKLKGGKKVGEWQQVKPTSHSFSSLPQWSQGHPPSALDGIGSFHNHGIEQHSMNKVSDSNSPQYFHSFQHDCTPQSTVMPSHLWQHSALPMFQQWQQQQQLQHQQQQQLGMEEPSHNKWSPFCQQPITPSALGNMLEELHMDSPRYFTPPNSRSSNRVLSCAQISGGKVDNSSQQEAAVVSGVSSLSTSDDTRSEDGTSRVQHSLCGPSAINRASYDTVQSFDSF